jgi:hypothetical protein
LKRAALAIALALCGVAMLSSLRERQRNAERELSGALDGAQRHVDFGIVLRTVRINESSGRVLLAGGPPLEVLREHRFGGVFDTLQRCWVGPTEAPVIWYVSLEQQEAVIHGEHLPEGVWFQGSMGAGKTTSGGIWLATRVIKHATRPLRGAGVTAPTDKRMEEIRKTLFGPKDRFGKRNGGMWPASWFTWREGDQVAVMATGLQIDFRSGHVQSPPPARRSRARTGRSPSTTSSKTTTSRTATSRCAAAPRPAVATSASSPSPPRTIRATARSVRASSARRTGRCSTSPARTRRSCTRATGRSASRR